jgi:hypothetical protein
MSAHSHIFAAWFSRMQFYAVLSVPLAQIGCRTALLNIDGGPAGARQGQVDRPDPQAGCGGAN